MDRLGRYRRLTLGALALAAAAILPSCGNDANTGYSLTTLSARQDAVSGGDVLVGVTSSGAPLDGLSLGRAGSQASVPLSSAPAGKAWSALVEGLAVGKNTIELRKDGRILAMFDVVNYPVTGPIFSGPHETPFFCETVAARLGEPLDADCSVATRYDYFYKSAADGMFKPYSADVAAVDIAMATIYGGTSVPYIVRVESGTIDRSIYRIAILDDPRAAPRDDAAWKPGQGWNGKLRYAFGGGCGFGRHQGVNQAAAVLDDVNLSRGFAVVTSTLNVYGTACNDVLSAEAAMMIKEHFIERYGVPLYTLGIGPSGGAMQQMLIAQNYPGILDGLVPIIGFPDGQTLVHTGTDCNLLITYFDAHPEGWTDEQKLAVSGFKVPGSCLDPMTNWGAQRTGSTSSINPRNCTPVIPKDQVYDPVGNRNGIRCTQFDSMPVYYGRDPNTGFVRRPLDNVGIQYGLAALNAGKISWDQFLDLNQHIGGFDRDGIVVPERTNADPEATKAGYARGRVFSGKGVFLPILQNRTYLDDGGGNVHTDWHSLEVRQRLVDANGHHDNEAIWISPPMPQEIGPMVQGRITDTMDRWLTALANDASEDSYLEKVRRAKPAEAVDGCFDGAGSFIAGTITPDNAGICGQAYPRFGTARTVAGSPLDEDRVKCQLKPVDLADYKTAPDATQELRLKSIFAAGVCDWSKDGVDQVPLEGKWISYGPAPGFGYKGE